MKIVFAAYRDWALQVLPSIQRHPRVTSVDLARSPRELELAVTGYCDMQSQEPTACDLVMLCGWSWQVSQQLLDKVPVVSEHPAYLDEYSLGTPLQGQIQDGIKRTKHRVVKIGCPELGQRLYSPDHETDMNLTGNMDDILGEMQSTARTIYARFLDDWPNIRWEQWDKAEEHRLPRKPQDSELSQAELHMGTRYLYDKIRMLEAPYPNAFIEDKEGTLYFERVRFKSKR
jgi:hypothetical protein